VKKNLTFAEDLAALFADDIEQPSVEMIDDLPAIHTATEKAIWDHELREFIKAQGNLQREPCYRSRCCLLGQCSESMKDKLRGALTDFKTETKTNNCAPAPTP
jgi:hypothetical protein